MFLDVIFFLSRDKNGRCFIDIAFINVKLGNYDIMV